MEVGLGRGDKEQLSALVGGGGNRCLGLTCWGSLRGFLLWAEPVLLTWDGDMPRYPFALLVRSPRSSSRLLSGEATLGGRRGRVGLGHEPDPGHAVSTLPQAEASITAPAIGVGASAPTRTSRSPSRYAQEHPGEYLPEPSLESACCLQLGVLTPHYKEGS